jgi:small subunit ribosomal protein S1
MGTYCNMVNRNLLSQIDQNELNEELDAVFQDEWYVPEDRDFDVNKIVTGRVVNLVGDDVVVDVGYKSEGARRT